MKIIQMKDSISYLSPIYIEVITADVWYNI